MERTEAAVAEALGRAHAALLADLRALEQAAHPASGEGLADLRARLGAAQTHIAEHFRFEEENGYMDTLRKREPRLERAIGRLAEEHSELMRSLEALLGGARAATGLDDALRAGVRDWIGQVRRHETRENDLVQDAYNLDLGAED